MPRRRVAIGGLGRGRAPRRKSVWIGSADTDVFQALAAAGTILDSSLGAAALALRPFTVVRTRGTIAVKSDQTAADEEGVLGFALAKVSDQASSIGITAVPTPITDEASDLFFVYQFAWFSWQHVTSGGGISIMTTEFESKAMRKVDIGEDIVTVVENASASFGVQFQVKFRILVKLH